MTQLKCPVLKLSILDISWERQMRKAKKLRREGGWPLKATTNSKCERKCPLKWPLKHCLTKLPNAAITTVGKKGNFLVVCWSIFCCWRFYYCLYFFITTNVLFFNPTLFISKRIQLLPCLFYKSNLSKLNNMFIFRTFVLLN